MTQRRSGPVLAAACSVAALLAMLLPTPAAAARPPIEPGLVRTTERLIQDSLRALVQRSGPTDRNYFAAGLWHSGDEGTWYCQTGPGLAAAALWRVVRRSDPGLFTLATTTFDRAIEEHRNPDGSFGEPTDSPDIATMFFGRQLGYAYLEIGSGLGAERIRRWRAALAGAASFLIRNGNVHWYTNGNINLGNTELFYLAWRATKGRRYLDAYERSFRFTLSPPTARWPGFGLRIVVPPTAPGEADGAGYLAESGGGAPGFDAEYAQVQLDAASRLYLWSRDPRALRLANLLVNGLRGRVDRNWTLDTSGGTRHPQPARRVPFTTPALAVLGWIGRRPDLRPALERQLARTDRVYRGALTYSNRNYYLGLGGQVAPILDAAEPLRPVLLPSIPPSAVLGDARPPESHAG